MQKLPVQTPTAEIDIRRYGGQTIFELRKVIDNIFRSKPAYKNLASFFAQPNVSGSSGILWYTSIEGSVRSYSEVDASLQQQARERLEQVHSQIDEIRSSFGGDRADTNHVAQALAAMLQTPSLDQSLFLVGDSWVLTQWGCYPYGATARPSIPEQIKSLPINEQERLISGPDEATTEVPTATEQVNSPPPPGPTVPPVTPEPVDPVTPQVAQPSMREEALEEKIAPGFPAWWRWVLLGLVLLLLLLLLLLWWKDRHESGRLGLVAEVAALKAQQEMRQEQCLRPGYSGLAPSQTGVAAVERDVEARLGERKLSRGKLNIALLWEGKEDLDLMVQAPGQVLMSYQNPRVGDGALDVDANRCAQASGCPWIPKPIENISWRSKPPPGRYGVYVRLYSSNSVRQNVRDTPFRVEVSQGDDKKVYEDIIRKTDLQCGAICSSGAKLITTITVER